MPRHAHITAKNLRRSRRLPAAAEAVQPAPGGRGRRFPAISGPTAHGMALVEGRGAARPASPESASGPGRQPGPGPEATCGTERGCVIAGSKTQTGPKHALPMTPRQMNAFSPVPKRSRDTWPSFSTPFSSLNIASKCLLGSVANEPCAISCGGHSLECPSVHEG